MTADERSDVEPTGEEAPYRSPEDVAGKAGDHEFPTTGQAGDMTSDKESLARRPPQDDSAVQGDTEQDGPRGTEPRRGGH